MKTLKRLLLAILAGVLALVAMKRETQGRHLTDNGWDVDFKGIRRPDQSMKELLCQLKNYARLRTVDGSDEPFYSLGWSSLVPLLPLEQLHRGQEYQGRFNTCAVVSSSGAMLHSGLGKEIDSHDQVMRFNHAPTEGYEKDVGSRTTIRVINTQVLTKPTFNFRTSSLYKNVIQGNALVDISPKPPTSGFMGIMVMMALCDEVTVYQYIPSPRQTDLCHYFEKVYDITCTLGGENEWQFEKRLIRRINIGKESDLRRGVVTLPGFSTVNN